MGKVSSVDAIISAQWACTPEYLETVLSVASRALEKPEAVIQHRGVFLQDAPRVEVRDGVAIVPVIGGIFRHANIITEFCGATSIERLGTGLGSVLESPEIHSIVLNIDSPGGEITGVHEFAQMVKAVGKPTIAYAGGLCASAAYWIASACDEIVADKTAQLGSIGVVAAWKDNSAAEKVQGIKRYQIVSSQSPKKRLDYDKAEGQEEVQGIIDALAVIFIDNVAENRGTTPEAVIDNFGQGSVLLGEDAVAVGMADRIGSLESIISDLAAKHEKAMSLQMENVMAEQTFKAEQIDRGWLAENRPDVLQALLNEGAAGADAKAAKAVEDERGRVAAIDALGIVGHDDLVTKAKAEGHSPEALAMAVVKAEGALRKVEGDKHKADAEESLVTPSVSSTGSESGVDAIIQQVAAAANARRK